MVTGEAGVEVRQHKGSLQGAVGSGEGVLEEGLLLDPCGSWLDMQAQQVEAVTLELHDETEPTTLKQYLGDNGAGSVSKGTIDKHCDPAGSRRRRS
jgi:hypothetical protein